MKKILVLIFFTIFYLNSNAQIEKKSITIKVTNIKNDKGILMVAIYSSKKDFLKKPYLKAIGKIKNKKSTIIFKDIEPGTYAISIIHDINSNKKLDFNFLGIPKEPTAASNNAKGTFGPPAFKDAKFKIEKENIIQTIKF
ncbi:MAG: DUF2141 domain-containing protein [Marinifilaceae bacterium]|jgi:uncharacterized protein (DUF2141 family)|nr:DUF2141 domain-containing protein [Marinifilaceae bacterium]